MMAGNSYTVHKCWKEWFLNPRKIRHLNNTRLRICMQMLSDITSKSVIWHFLEQGFKCRIHLTYNKVVAFEIFPGKNAMWISSHVLSFNDHFRNKSCENNFFYIDVMSSFLSSQSNQRFWQDLLLISPMNDHRRLLGIWNIAAHPRSFRDIFSHFFKTHKLFIEHLL